MAELGPRPARRRATRGWLARRAVPSAVGTGRTTGDGRWPECVYGAGTEPDYRYSLANERTFLAWVRTALALLAAGVAVDVVDMSLGRAQPLLASLLVVSGLVMPPAAWVRWARSERAMRRREPLPAFGSAVAVALTVALAASTTVVGVWGDG